MRVRMRTRENTETPPSPEGIVGIFCTDTETPATASYHTILEGVLGKSEGAPALVPLAQSAAPALAMSLGQGRSGSIQPAGLQAPLKGGCEGECGK